MTPEIQEINQEIRQIKDEITEKNTAVLRLRREITDQRNTQGDWRRTDLHVSYIHNFHR
jgi:predicted  nucleic acid-binding Zn-ribbon protein